LAHLRALLVEQLTFRVDQLAQLHDHGDGPLSSDIPEIVGELAAGARAALREVQAALRRMDDGVYGLCTTCGEWIGRERLEILPQAALCMSCQAAATRFPSATTRRRGAAEAVGEGKPR